MTNNIKVRMHKDGAFPINTKLAGLVPMAIEAEQAALTQDIKDNEQRDPIVLWKGEVVDGRCRQQALITLNKPIIYKELDDSVTEDEVAVFVKSINVRRNLTITQKAMSAAKSKITGRDNRSNYVIAKSWAIGEKLVQNAKYIWVQNTTIANDLFNGKAVYIINDKGIETTSTKVTAIYAYLKRLEEKVTDTSDTYGWSATSYIDTQAGKDWFYKTIAIVKGNNSETHKLIAELANYKFKRA